MKISNSFLSELKQLCLSLTISFFNVLIILLVVKLEQKRRKLRQKQLTIHFLTKFNHLKRKGTIALTNDVKLLIQYFGQPN